jgi:hypothetical protein
MSWISETMLCGACDHQYPDTIKRSERDDTYKCPECGEAASKRTWSIPNVSTEKLSRSLPDVVGTGRFDRLKQKQALTKERAAARETGDRVSEKKLTKEIRKVNK